MLNRHELEVTRRIDALVDVLKPDLPEHLKRRDPAEPGRTEKEVYEDRLTKLVQRRFNAQKKRVIESAKFVNVAVPETEAKILQLMLEMARHGLLLFSEAVGVGFDYGEYSITTIEAAREFVGTMIKKIDETTLKAVQDALNTYANTPGMTIGQLEAMLPFQGFRARQIAITETTNLYAGIENILGIKLKQEFSDVRVVKTWFTNNDDIVRRCHICWPLHGKTVEVNEAYNDAGLEAPPGHPGCRCWHTVRTQIE